MEGGTSPTHKILTDRLAPSSHKTCPERLPTPIPPIACPPHLSRSLSDFHVLVAARKTYLYSLVLTGSRQYASHVTAWSCRTCACDRRARQGQCDELEVEAKRASPPGWACAPRAGDAAPQAAQLAPVACPTPSTRDPFLITEGLDPCPP